MYGFSSITKCTCNMVVVYVAVSWPQHLVILLVNYKAIKSIGAKWGCKKQPQRQPQCWGSYRELSGGEQVQVYNEAVQSTIFSSQKLTNKTDLLFLSLALVHRIIHSCRLLSCTFLGSIDAILLRLRSKRCNMWWYAKFFQISNAVMCCSQAF